MFNNVLKCAHFIVCVCLYHSHGIPRNICAANSVSIDASILCLRRHQSTTRWDESMRQYWTKFLSYNSINGLLNTLVCIILNYVDKGLLYSNRVWLTLLAQLISYRFIVHFNSELFGKGRNDLNSFLNIGIYLFFCKCKQVSIFWWASAGDAIAISCSFSLIYITATLDENLVLSFYLGEWFHFKIKLEARIFGKHF